MKKLQLSFILCLFFTVSKAQIEVRANLMGLVGYLGISGEYCFSKKIGIEASASRFSYKQTVSHKGFLFSYNNYRHQYKTSRTQVGLLTKYYFIPNYGNDRVYIGLFLGSTSIKNMMTIPDLGPTYKSSGILIGYQVGYKWISKHGIILDIGAGIGYLFGERATHPDVPSKIDSKSKLIGTFAIGYRFGRPSAEQKKEISALQARMEVKTNFAGLFGDLGISGEYFINENIGIELSAKRITIKTLGEAVSSYISEPSKNLRKSGFRASLSGKYYFIPKHGCDRLYAGMYVGPKSIQYSDTAPGWNYKINRISTGIVLGYKLVSKSGYLVELATGFGRLLGKHSSVARDYKEGPNASGQDFFTKIAVGYRFRKKSSL